MAIHPTACVEEGVELGQGVEVGPFAYIESGAKVGDESRIGPHAVIHASTSLGRSCRVHAGAVIGDLPQDLAFKDVESCVKIGDRCVIREGATIHRGTAEGTATVVGDDCYMMAASHLGHNVRLGNSVIVVNGVLLAGYVDVGDGAFISGNAAVHQFVRIGRLAMIGGLGSIGQDVLPFCMTVAKDRNTIAGVNVIGLRRAGMGPEDRMQVKAAFAMLYQSGDNIRTAVEKMQAAFTEGPGREMADFVAGSERGICTIDRSGSANRDT